MQDTITVDLPPRQTSVRAAHGRAARAHRPRSSLGEWTPRGERPDPVEILETQALSRVPELLPIRYGRMADSPFAFYRGAAAIMAEDLGASPHSGLHPLLKRWLSERLRREAPQRWSEIHRRAAKELEADGDVDLAFQHSETAEDVASCEGIVRRHGGLSLTRGRNLSVASWFAALPVDRVRSSPGLCAIRSVQSLHLADEVGAHQWLRLADLAVDARSRTDDGWDEGLRWVTVVHAGLDERKAAEQLPALLAVRDQLDDPAWRNLADYLLGGLTFLDSGFAAAFAHLDRGIFEAEVMDTPLLQVDCLAMAAVLHACEDDWSAAGERARRASEVMRRRHVDLVPPSAHLLALNALLSARAGRREDALAQLLASRRALGTFRTSTPWLNVITRLPLVRTTLLLDARDAGRELLAELEFHARLELDDGGESDLVTVIRDLRHQVDSMHRPATGSAALTDAELRVLQYLPTNLSLGDIATRLYVSRNTVKSQVANIYRKLDAENRATAVERARSAGLLSV